MTPTQINRSSWHYRLAFHYTNGHRERDAEDSCSYLSMVFKGFLNVLLITGLLGSGVAGIYSFFFWSFMIGFNEAFLFAPTTFYMIGVALIALGFVFLCICLWMYCWDKIKEKRNSRRYEAAVAPPGFLKILKTKLADKICTEIEYK